jgi:Spy/CpxP family protein refolding chaperone
MMKCVTALLFAIAVIAAPCVAAEGSSADVTDMAALRTAVRADKKAFVAATLKLTDAEAKKFWPVYDAYQRDLDLANRKRSVAVEALIGTDKAISDLYAKSLSNEMISADEIELKARRTIHNRLIKPLPGRAIMPAIKGARYLQLESKIRAYQAYDLAATIPLVK